MARVKHRSIVLTISSLVTVITTTLLALAIYVNIARPVVGKVSHPGFPAVNVEAARWNIACTVLGTAVGILVTAGLAYDDGSLTREAILSKEGVAPFYLRPLTIMRGMDQIRHGWSHVTRMILICLTIVAALFTTATVAIFGVHNVEQSLSNPSASWPLATILDIEADGMYSSAELVKTPYDLNALDAFLFRIAYIQGLNTSKRHESEYPKYLSAWLPETGQLGDTLYPTLRTGGIGLNTSSYIDYTGRPREGFDVPAIYTFNKLHGTVFGTHVNVKCTEAPHLLKTELVSANDYALNTWYYQITTQKGAKLEFLADLDILKIGSALVNYNGLPVLTIAIPYDSKKAFVTECTYSGNDFAASVSLDSRVSPLKVLGETRNGASINKDTKWILANSMNNLLSLQAGGSLTRAWQSTTQEGPMSTDQSDATTRSFLETILSQMGEALISLKRQDLEKADLYHAFELPTGSAITVFVTVSQLGGGTWPWLSVYILVLLGSLLSIFRCCKRLEVLEIDVQDPLRVLEVTLAQKEISLKSRIRFREKLEVI